MKTPFAAAEDEWIKNDQQGELFERSEFLPCRLSSFRLREMKWKNAGHVLVTCPKIFSLHQGIGSLSFAYFSFVDTKKSMLLSGKP